MCYVDIESLIWNPFVPWTLIASTGLTYSWFSDFLLAYFNRYAIPDTVACFKYQSVFPQQQKILKRTAKFLLDK